MAQDSWTEAELAAHYAALKTPPDGTGDVPDVLEAVIQEDVTKFLECDGWRALRTDPVSDRRRGKGFGEIGMADMMFIRYWGSHVGRAPQGHDTRCNALALAAGNHIMWIEFKRGRGGVLAKSQRDWHNKERARGALTLIAGEDFTPSLKGFRAWYRASGLERRR